MRIRGKKPWALVDRKIRRFKTQAEFSVWMETTTIARLQANNELTPEQWLTSDEVWASLEVSAKSSAAREAVTRKKPKKRIKRRRLWPA